MAYDEALAERLRQLLSSEPRISEKKMFGGICFLKNGNMICGVVGSELMVRVGPEQYETALNKAHAREMDFTGKPLRGFVYVGEKGISTKKGLTDWVRQGLSFVSTLPVKKK